MTVNEILDAMNQKLVELWPDRTVYVDVCPADFDRPSFWLRVAQDKVTDASRVCVKHDAELLLVLHDQLDEHYDASWYRLSDEATRVMDLFGRVLTVGERKITLTMSSLPRDPDKATIRVLATWFDPRPEAVDRPTEPVAETYSVQVTVKT